MPAFRIMSLFYSAWRGRSGKCRNDSYDGYSLTDNYCCVAIEYHYL